MLAFGNFVLLVKLESNKYTVSTAARASCNIYSITVGDIVLH